MLEHLKNKHMGHKKNKLYLIEIKVFKILKIIKIKTVFHFINQGFQKIKVHILLWLSLVVKKNKTTHLCIKIHQ